MTDDTSTDTPQAEPVVVVATTKRWYVVHAYSGMEKAVERNLRERIDRAAMQANYCINGMDQALVRSMKSLIKRTILSR